MVYYLKFTNLEISQIITNQSILSITESKLDSSVTNAEVNINGYSVIRNDRDVVCYIRDNLCSNTNNIFQILLNVYFSKFSSQKLNLL